MAKVTNSYTTYDTAANREVISEAIANLDPSSTPFMSAIGKKTVDNVVLVGKQKIYQALALQVNWKVLRSADKLQHLQ